MKHTSYLTLALFGLLASLGLPGCSTPDCSTSNEFYRRNTRTVAVLCEVDGSGDLASGAQSIFANAMESALQRKGFRLVERERLQVILNQLNLQSSRFFVRGDPEKEKLISLLGLDAVVLCQVRGLQYDRLMQGNYHRGTQYVRAANLSARMIDLTSAEVLCRGQKSALYGLLEAGAVVNDPLIIVKRPAMLISECIPSIK